MIHLSNPEDCVGCNACVQRCPKQCISMHEDHEGFLYPLIDQTVCIDCGLCEKVCPVLHQADERKPLAVYAAKNKDEQIRKESSSGGVFTLLAEQVLAEGGVVFGARFDENWDVVHDYAETVAGLAAFRGSKYVQSRIGETFAQAEQFLKEGRKVLYSGTPCQIAGLNRFLLKKYDLLLTVDFICHGVPSPRVWSLYLDELLARQSKKNSVLTHPNHSTRSEIQRISFRDKQYGWKKFSFALTLSVPISAEENTVMFSEPLNKNIFMRGFLKDLYLRPSCHACPAKSFKSGSDIVIGDFWGIHNCLPEYDDDKGVSLIIINKISSQSLLSRLDLRETDYQWALNGNSAITKSVQKPKKRSLFFCKMNRLNIIALINCMTQPTIKQRFNSFLYAMIYKYSIIKVFKLISNK